MPFFMQQILGDDEGGSSDDVVETTDGVLNRTESGTSAKDGLQVIGIMRLLRLLRLLKLVRHYEGSAVLANALERSTSALLVPLFFLTLLCFVFAGHKYGKRRERDQQVQLRAYTNLREEDDDGEGDGG